MITRQPSRTSVPGRALLPAHAQTTRPRIPTRRTHSYHLAPGRGQSQPSSKLGPAGNKKVITEVVSQPDAEQEEEVAGFPQFCPVCERQIVTPSASVLFCSEA
ncbi:hypothetical protein LTR12_004873 [Friedmanniomyces endolithicus]|nr:hypothetical protein LTR74_002075 [Friedmanniomyces endolithicus]KAK1820709.1 hypothetical protein LTR12_004873 [Friedmanniomyces endolithicus]